MKQPSMGINGKADRWISRWFAHDMRINKIKEQLIKGSLYSNEQGWVDTVTLFFPAFLSVICKFYFSQAIKTLKGLSVHKSIKPPKSVRVENFFRKEPPSYFLMNSSPLGSSHLATHSVPQEYSLFIQLPQAYLAFLTCFHHLQPHYTLQPAT